MDQRLIKAQALLREISEKSVVAWDLIQQSIAEEEDDERRVM